MNSRIAHRWADPLFREKKSQVYWQTQNYDAKHAIAARVQRIKNWYGISDYTSITYDGTGNRTGVTASIPGASSLNGTTGYTYDSKNQLTQETSTRNGGFTDNFGYDDAGNPTTFKGVTNFYNSNNQHSGTGFSYDSNGNPTTYGGTTVTFDPAEIQNCAGGQ